MIIAVVAVAVIAIMAYEKAINNQSLVDINNLRKKLKKTKGEDFINNIDKIFDKYYSMIWAKFEPIIGNFYKENSSVFRNYVFHILSKGKEKLDRLLDNDVKNSIDISSDVLFSLNF